MFIISLWQLFFAALAGFIIGFVWYHPRVFGAMWMRMSGITPEAAEKGKQRMIVSMIVGFLALLWTAWVLSYVLQAFGVFDWISALETGFWVWAGFIAPVMLGMVLWEQRSFKLYALNVIHWLAVFLAMSFVLTW